MGDHRSAQRPASATESRGRPRGASALHGTGVRAGLAVVLVALLAGGAYVVWDQNRVTCDQVQQVSVIADSGVKDYVTRLAEETQTQSCFDFTVEAVDPSHTNERLNQRKTPHIWVAESQARIRQVRSTLGRSWSDIGPSLGTSPVVMAGNTLPESPTWTKALSTPTLRVDPPSQSDVSNAAVIGALSEVSGGSLTHQKLIEGLTKRALMMNDTDGSPDLAAVATSPDPVVALTTEHEYVKFVEQNPDSPLQATVPASGTVNLDYRIADVSQPSEQGLASAAIKALVDALQSEQGQRIRAEEAIRSADSAPLPDNAGVRGVTVIDAPDRELADNVLRKWTALTKPIRTIVVQDVSGSMKRDAGGRTRAELLREASLFGLKQFPKNTALGYWEFSINRGGDGKDYREVLPIRALSEETDGRSQRDALKSAISETLGNLEGGTGLYDTALAAFRSVYGSYDPAYSNSVIIMTDGRNEDRDSITLANLVSELNIMKNPARRIPIITVGISEDADAAALKKIAEATGGSSFIARDPKDIGSILLQAVSFRAEGA